MIEFPVYVVFIDVSSVMWHYLSLFAAPAPAKIL